MNHSLTLGGDVFHTNAIESTWNAMKKRANYFCGINSAKVLRNIEEIDFNEDTKELNQNWIMYDYWMRSIMNTSLIEK